MPSRDDPLRLFVTLYPPIDVARSLIERSKELSPPPFPRFTPIEQVHMTLLFIGDTDPRQLDGVIESVERAAAGIGPFTLQPEHLVYLPERGTPRLIAAATDSPAQLIEIQRRLASRLARPGIRSHFLPHITLGRYAHGETPTRVNSPMNLEPFPVSEIRLMRSVLAPSGARHDLVAHAPLTN